MMTNDAMNTLSRNPKSQRGFTLVETLVAISILMVALIGPFETVEHALTASYQSRDELIASSLAQEAVEYVLNVRDNNYLADRTYGYTYTWLRGFDGTGGPNCYAPNSCTVDVLASVNPVVLCPTNSCSTVPLYVTSAGSTYPDSYNQSTSGTLTKFVRSISLSPTSMSNEVKLTVTVKWSTNKQPYTTTITEYVQNWL
jgi:prepilin-type N-terminal cleavage/methylation domain-containing protein